MTKQATQVTTIISAHAMEQQIRAMIGVRCG